MLHHGAHSLRNDIATMRMAAHLVDDDDVAASIGEALDDLQVRIERAIVAARIELDERPRSVELDAAELVRLGTSRAAREGTREPSATIRIAGGVLTVPGPWAERLVADLLHDAPEQWTTTLAHACGIRVEVGGMLEPGSGARELVLSEADR